MFPSNNFLALVRAYDPFTPPARSMEELRLQNQRLLDSLGDAVDYVSQLLKSVDLPPSVRQNRYDAVLSIIYDVGIEFFNTYMLPDIVVLLNGKRRVRLAITSLPAFADTLLPGIEAEARRRKMSNLSRRHFEAELFFGNVWFAIGRQKGAEPDSIVYAPYLIHPVLQFLMKGANQ